VPARFVDITTQSGIQFRQVASHTAKKYLLETMGSGVALFDYNNDGRLDIFVVNGAQLNDPTAKGTSSAKGGSKRLESPLPPKSRWQL
jgi:enediyne biosynthesis protein E4